MSAFKYPIRWFTYLDLLGFSNLVHQRLDSQVLSLYRDVIAEVEERAKKGKRLGIGSSWFSDTFIIFSRGRSEEEFCVIESISRTFFQKLILREIPARAALTIGPVYTQQKKNIFLGKGLIDAYRYGEQQDWIGFILTPSVYRNLKGSSISPDRLAFYRRVEEKSIIRHPESDDVFAFTFDNGSLNGRNIYGRALSAMKEAAGLKHRKKYENTEAFISKHSLFSS